MAHRAVPGPKELGRVGVRDGVELLALFLKRRSCGAAELSVQEQNPELAVLESQCPLERGQEGIDIFAVAASEASVARKVPQLLLDIVGIVLVAREESRAAARGGIVERRWC
jgi:hypothetical protein